MREIQLGRWRLSIDREATVKAYQKCEVSAGVAYDAYWRNFEAAQAVAYTEEVLELFDTLGINPHCEAEVVYGAPVGPNLHDYEVWYHFVGTILSGRDAWRKIDDRSYVPDLCVMRERPYLGFGFTERLGLVSANFHDLLLVQLELVAHVPWVIDVPEPK